jgi:hypothetical protein
MNHFFCESDLTEEQRSKWHELMNQYNAVLRMNTIMKARAMSDAERALCASILGITVESESEFEEKFVTHSVDLTAFGGSPRSALFARLLKGISPLPFPPPTNFGFPWYEVVEESGPFSVKARPSGGDIVINQCRWRVVGRNEAALRLLTLHEKASEGVRSDWIRLSDSKDLIDIVRIYSEEPEFMVTYPGAGLYRLFVDGSGSEPLREYLHGLWAVESTSLEFRSVFSFLSDMQLKGKGSGESGFGWCIQKTTEIN